MRRKLAYWLNVLLVRFCESTDERDGFPSRCLRFRGHDGWHCDNWSHWE